jgi:hypothetical protein
MAPKNNLILEAFLAAPQIKLPTVTAYVSSQTRKFLTKNMNLDFFLRASRHAPAKIF